MIKTLCENPQFVIGMDRIKDVVLGLYDYQCHWRLMPLVSYASGTGRCAGVADETLFSTAPAILASNKTNKQKKNHISLSDVVLFLCPTDPNFSITQTNGQKT